MHSMLCVIGREEHPGEVHLFFRGRDRDGPLNMLLLCVTKTMLRPQGLPML